MNSAPESETLMNPNTGSVDTRSNWAAEGYDEKDGLILVGKNENGDWEEV
jgi:hypothetical protein